MMKHRFTILLTLLTLALLLGSCQAPPAGKVPAVTTAPIESSEPQTDPPVTNPPVTNPPVTDPPATTPPVTDPPVTTPPETEPPVTNPPETEPPTTTPPVINPPTSKGHLVYTPLRVPEPYNDISYSTVGSFIDSYDALLDYVAELDAACIPDLKMEGVISYREHFAKYDEAFFEASRLAVMKISTNNFYRGRFTEELVLPRIAKTVIHQDNLRITAESIPCRTESANFLFVLERRKSNADHERSFYMTLNAYTDESLKTATTVPANPSRADSFPVSNAPAPEKVTSIIVGIDYPTGAQGPAHGIRFIRSVDELTAVINSSKRLRMNDDYRFLLPGDNGYEDANLITRTDRAYGESPSFERFAARYDAKWFENNLLVLLITDAGSGTMFPDQPVLAYYDASKPIPSPTIREVKMIDGSLVIYPNIPIIASSTVGYHKDRVFKGGKQSYEYWTCLEFSRDNGVNWDLISAANHSGSSYYHDFPGFSEVFTTNANDAGVITSIVGAGKHLRLNDFGIKEIAENAIDAATAGRLQTFTLHTLDPLKIPASILAKMTNLESISFRIQNEDGSSYCAGITRDGVAYANGKGITDDSPIKDRLAYLCTHLGFASFASTYHVTLE